MWVFIEVADRVVDHASGLAACDDFKAGATKRKVKPEVKLRIDRGSASSPDRTDGVPFDSCVADDCMRERCVEGLKKQREDFADGLVDHEARVDPDRSCWRP